MSTGISTTNRRVRLRRQKRAHKLVVNLLAIAALVINCLFVYILVTQIKSAQSTPEGATKKPKAKTTSSDYVEGDSPANSWELRLVNLEHPLPEDYAPPSLKTISNTGYQIDARIAENLEAMLKQSKKDGVNLSILSAYRSIPKQTELFNNKVSSYVKQGYSEQDAYIEAATIVSVPQCSEHNYGMAIDFNNLTENFSETAEYKWLMKHAADYGFIRRYPEDKSDVTGIIYEPWHYRFVGKEHANKIMTAGLCLEEYLDQLNRQYSAQSSQIASGAQ